MRRKGALYLDIDPFVCEWTRELMKAGHIAPGVADSRSISEIQPEELNEFCQVHLFSGIAVWSYALRAAGWPDDRPVWTASCPCQPWSAAGKRGGAADERHLWPEVFRLADKCRPLIIFGEQVASKDGLAWFDLVSTDMERAGYTIGAVDSCAAGFGAPHIRQRLYFVADSQRDGRREERSFVGRIPSGNSLEGFTTRLVSGSADSGAVVNPSGEQVGLSGCSRESRGTSSCRMGNAGSERRQQISGSSSCDESSNGREPDGDHILTGSGLTNGFWREADWIYCRDEKYRPVEAGTFPLAHGIANRVGKLRGYGNAIVAPVAQAFIESFLEVESQV